MYDSIFKEDSKAFVDYYYQHVVPGNRILAADSQEQDSRKIQCMIHFNPHMLNICGNAREAYYLVAVATRPECRKQGIMGRLMEHALKEIAKNHMPFTFLMPANPAYYYGQGFSFFPNQPLEKTQAGDGFRQPEEKIQEGSSFRKPEEELQVENSFDQLKGEVQEESSFRKPQEELQDKSSFGRLKRESPVFQWRRARVEDTGEIALFANRILERQSQIFVQRSKPYYEQLMAETTAEDGAILLLEISGVLQGILAYGTEQNGSRQFVAEIQELLLGDRAKALFASMSKAAICQTALPGYGVHFPAFPMMARITDLFSLVPLLKSQSPKLYTVDLTDRALPAHNGCFQISLDASGGTITRVPKTGAEQKLDISQLFQLLLSGVPVQLTEWV